MGEVFIDPEKLDRPFFKIEEHYIKTTFSVILLVVYLLKYLEFTSTKAWNIPSLKPIVPHIQVSRFHGNPE